jgi:hypothetical protein
VRVSEAEVVKAAEVVRPTKRPFEIERYLRARVRVGHGHQRTQRKHTTVSVQRDVLLQVGFRTLERIRVAIEVVEALVREQVPAALPRIPARLAQVDVDDAFVAHEVWLLGQTRRRRIVEAAPNRIAPLSWS